MKITDVRYVTLIEAEDGLTVKAYSTARYARLAAMEYIKSWPKKMQWCQVSDWGQRIETMSLAAFTEACNNGMIPEYELQMGY